MMVSEKFRDTFRLMSAVANQADRAVVYQAKRNLVVYPQQIKDLRTPLAGRPLAAPCRLTFVESSTTVAIVVPSPQLVILTGNSPQAAQDFACVLQEEDQGHTARLPARQQVWFRQFLSKKAVAFGAMGLGAAGAFTALLVWSGGLMAGPALQLAGFGSAANVKAGAVAVSLGSTLAAGGVCAAACGSVSSSAAVPLLSNAVLSAAAGGSLLGGAGKLYTAAFGLRAAAEHDGKRLGIHKQLVVPALEAGRRWTRNRGNLDH